MATLVLSAVGTVIGGPLGGAIGALLGNQIDNAVLGETREGPRLTDLAVQTSQYGTVIPRIYGRMRVAGTVVWATDLIEHRERRGGKGRSSQTNYSYSVSFAVALSSRPVQSIGRIWADGNLLRGGDGDFKTETGFRLHHGFANQESDPLIAALEGAQASPAFRDYAYCVFEDFDLSEYGNRIPSLTFEVIADTGKLSVARLLRDFPGIAPDITAEAAPPPDRLTGYAVRSESWRAVIEELLTAFPIYADWGAQGLRLNDAAQHYGQHDGTQRDAIALLRRADQLLESDTANIAAERRDSPHRQPEAIALRYYEPERDFQAGLRRSAPGVSVGAGPARTLQLDLPAAMTVDDAQAVVQRLHLNQLASVSERTLYFAAIDPKIRPGSIVRLIDNDALQTEGTDWRVTSWALENIAVQGQPMLACRIDLIRAANNSRDMASLSQHAGRSVQSPDYPAVPMDWALLDLPSLPNQLADQRRLFAAAWPAADPAAQSPQGDAAGWRYADIFRATEDGGLLLSLGRIRSPAHAGTTITGLGPSSGLLFQPDTSLDVDLHMAGLPLESLDRNGIDAGGNVAMIGAELIQFGKAEWLGGGRYRLSEIYRALGDGRGADAGHAAGTRFIMLDAALLALDVQGFAADTARHYAAAGPANSDPLLRGAAQQPRALRPLAPVHLCSAVDSAGDLTIGWTRRDRHRPGWTDGPQAPMAESDERYRVILTDAETVDAGDPAPLAIFETQAPALVISAAQLSSLEAAAAAIAISVQQIGDFGLSESAQIILR